MRIQVTFHSRYEPGREFNFFEFNTMEQLVDNLLQIEEEVNKVLEKDQKTEDDLEASYYFHKEKYGE